MQIGINIETLGGLIIFLILLAVYYGIKRDMIIAKKKGKRKARKVIRARKRGL